MKKCCCCKETKDLKDFNKNRSRKDGFNSICRICSNKRSKKYYQDNLLHHRKVVRSRVKRVTKENQIKINQLKSSGCTICFEPNIECLDLHHLPHYTKLGNISVLVSCYYWSKVVKEIAKCIVVCANCHRKITRKTLFLLPHIKSPYENVDGDEAL